MPTDLHLLLQADPASPLTDYLQRLMRSGSGLWGVVVELLLIAIVTYAALRFLKGTRGWRVLKSFGLIIVTSFLVVRLVAERLHLERIIFLYPYFFNGVVLTTLIAFQPEIRRGFIRLGDARWFRSFAKRSDPIIEPLVTAVAKLSQKKIGALIAVQRHVGLDALCETGVRIDADVRSELLETIFWPGTLLHDMGVIIQHGRIAAAACQFPIAESGELALALGSRHRAALGLSHESDALIIVVSEETGTISVAQSGVFKRHLTPATLRALLEEGFIAQPSSAADSKDADDESDDWKPDRGTDGRPVH
ncbi:MAG: TIGR00159 family protein [Phycisphaerales bacterium]|nr:TIGR00159 family protein [Phycisphaerales bacterium]